MFWRRKRDKKLESSQEKPASFTGLLLDGMTAEGSGPCDYDSEGVALIHKLASEGRIDVLREVLQHGADPNLPARLCSAIGWTPLHFAALKGHADVLELLIEYGAEVDTASEKLHTPLHIAAHAGHAPAICALLAHGADTRMRDDVGKTALDYAQEEGHSELARLLSGPSTPQDTRFARLGYSLSAMLEEAERNGLYQDEESFPIIPEVLPTFDKASEYFLNIVESQEPRMLETFMHHSCRYLWGKAVEAAFLWAKSIDGKISINFEAGEMANETITTDLPEELEAIVVSSMDEFLPYFKAHQDAIMVNQSSMSPNHMGKEMAVTLQYFPRIGMAYAISKGYHEAAW